MSIATRLIIPRIQALKSRGRLTLDYPVRFPRSCCFDLRSGSSLSIGRGSAFRERVVFRIDTGATVSIGKDVFVNDGCEFNSHEKIEIEEGVMFGQNVLLYDHDHDYRRGPVSKRSEFVTAPIVVKKNAWIGSNVVILKGVTIGENSIVAAGAVVTKDIPDNSLFYNKREGKIIDISEYKNEVC